MEHGPELGIALLVSFALASGAALRWVSKKIGLPYTVSMLALGGVLGLGLRRLAQSDGGSSLGLSGGELPALSSDTILFIFLPALVFESAFALDVHAFRRNLPAVATLAVPAMLVSTLLTAGAVSLVTGLSWGWSFAACLVFGALISATDPVAVVAVLRELGAPKRLSLLIEGESLLNDGTAIVAFHVVLGLLVAAGTTFDPGHTALDFLRVVTGGILVGLLLAWIATAWLARTFNDPLVEITVTLVLAYASMAIAEGLLDVSGVMAIVTAGLWMAGPGQTRISPEVRHFLHRFWGMLAFLANTLIFFLVGLLIATHLEGAVWSELGLIAGVFLAIVVVRFVVTFAFLPILRSTSEPVRVREATVLAWGGLRGAVSLALALVVSQTESLDPALRMQLLRLTAGVVLLTILVNGTTTGWLLRRLGFITPSPSEALATESTLLAALGEVDERLDELSLSPQLASLPFGEVRASLTARRERLRASIDSRRDALGEAGEDERERELWQRALRIEREAHWRSFSDGVLGRVALTILVRAIDAQLDDLRAGRIVAPEHRCPPLAGFRMWVARRLRTFGVAFGAVELGRVALVHDMSRAEAGAAETVLAALEAVERTDDACVEQVAEVYRRWRRGAKARLAALSESLPEVVAAIEARLTQRIALNVERDRLASLASRGALQERAAEEAKHDIEVRMKRLAAGPVSGVTLAETVDLCRATRLFRGLAEETLDELAQLTIEQALVPGEELFHQGDTGDAMYVVARGAIRVSRIDPGGEDREVAVLGRGEIVGEMALLGGHRRNATATALTGALVGRVSKKAFDGLLESRPRLRRRVWQAFARHAIDDLARAEVPDRTARRGWLADRAPEEVDGEVKLDSPWTLVLRGTARRGDETLQGPRLIRSGDGGWSAEGLIVSLPAPPSSILV